ncbi:MAG: LysM peptidoglycan-binding domain-containing protein [Acidobacteria bacterium]|nr:LysM peptidoglycan-binding domain-containing protein [Acidobacteriota bacterium]
MADFAAIAANQDNTLLTDAVDELDPVENLISEADEIYLHGVASLRQGYDLDARRSFDEAVSIYLHAPGRLADDPRLVEQYEDVLDSIHRAAVDARAGGVGELLVPAENLRAITAFLSPADAVREEERVRARNATVAYDMPVEINKKVVAFIDAFSGPRKKLFEPGMVRSGRYVPLIRRIFREEGIPQDLCYMAHVESAFKPNAYSRARAKGLFQFIASTGRQYKLKSDWWVDMRSDPELSARAAARYLKALYAVYGDWYLSLAEYNGGSRVRRAWQRSGRKADFWDLARTTRIRRETRNYVPQILAAIVLHKAPEKYGLTTERAKPLAYNTMLLNESLDLRVAARLAGTTLEEMIALNPALRRMATPPDYKNFPLRLPPDSGERFKTDLAKLPAAEKLPWYHHRVRRGETLSTIATRYGASVYSIQKANSLRNPHRISIGQDLMIPGSAVRVAALNSTPRSSGTPDGTRVTHRVRRGESLYSIARRYRTDVRSLASWNSIADPRLIRSGQRLVVFTGTRAGGPAPAGSDSARAGGAGRQRVATTYTVRKGDTLYEISRRFGVSVRAMQSWNGLYGRTLIHPGKKLTIYR